MTSQAVEERKGGPCRYIASRNWRMYSGNTYECRVLLLQEKDGGYSAIATRLPGVASQGESIDEALANISEAFVGAVSLYLEQDGHIPWSDEPVDRPKESIERWILVHV